MRTVVAKPALLRIVLDDGYTYLAVTLLSSPSSAPKLRLSSRLRRIPLLALIIAPAGACADPDSTDHSDGTASGAEGSSTTSSPETTGSPAGTDSSNTVTGASSTDASSTDASSTDTTGTSTDASSTGAGDESTGTTGDAMGSTRIVLAGSTGDPDYDPQQGPPPPAAEGWVASFTFHDEQGAGVTLDWSRQDGGSFNDWFNDVALAPDGTIYATGFAGSGDLPTTQGVVSPSAYNDGWLARYDAGGTILMMTYLGGSYGNDATAVSVDSDGFVYVSGTTGSNEFPVTAGAYQTTLGFRDYFVAKLQADGSDYVWATFVGGPDYDDFAGRNFVDGAGNVYLTGTTTSYAFPTTTGAYATTKSSGGDAGEHGEEELTVLKLSADGSQMTWGTYLGGNDSDYGYSPWTAGGIALADNGDVIVCGTTRADDFPIVGGVQPTKPGNNPAAFVARLSADGSTLLASSYIGGSGHDYCQGLDLDNRGNVVLLIDTGSNDLLTQNAVQDTLGGIGDIAVLKLTPNLDSVVFSTYLGGSEGESGGGVSVLGDRIYVTGSTTSIDFPVTPDATQPNHAGESDAFLVALSGDGQSIEFSTYLGFTTPLGNPQSDRAMSLASAYTPGIDP